MKSKKLLITIISIALVACTAIAGTYAAFTARDDTAVKNTFTFANGLTVELKEATPVDIGEALVVGDNDRGFSYSNIVPGQELDKKPYINVSATFKSYVFIKVSGLSADVSLLDPAEITDNGWTAIGETDAYGNGIYYKVVDRDDNADKVIFSKVKVTDDPEADLADDKIVVAVTATQFDGFADAAAALEAAPEFATVS